MIDLQQVICEWGDETFPNGTVDAVLCHFFDEVVELAQAAGMIDDLFSALIDRKKNQDDRPRLADESLEAADCVMLLLHFAHKRGFNLLDEVVKKFEINKTRTWEQPDERGVVRHKRIEND
jgi:hypothetical protein